MWIPITLAATTFQILRTSRQHRLRSILSANAAGFVRYAYGFPLAMLATVVTFGAFRADFPTVPARFWLIIAGGGIAQIIGTIALLRSFDLRDFAIGTVYPKTEIVIVAMASAVLLGESLRPAGWIAALKCVVGVAWLAARGDLRSTCTIRSIPPRGWVLLPPLGSRSLRSAFAQRRRHWATPQHGVGQSSRSR